MHACILKESLTVPLVFYEIRLERLPWSLLLRELLRFLGVEVIGGCSPGEFEMKAAEGLQWISASIDKRCLMAE